MITEYLDICVICGKPASETHHLVYGRGMRALADANSLTIPLCQKCHKEIHYNGTAGSLSKIIGQLQYEHDYCMSSCPDENIQREAREQFRNRYGRSYL